MITFGKKRPWKKYAKIERVELNNGDVRFEIGPTLVARARDPKEFGMPQGPYQARDAALTALDVWWAAWWPVQEKSRRPA